MCAQRPQLCYSNLFTAVKFKYFSLPNLFMHREQNERWSAHCVNCSCHKNWYLYSLSVRCSAMVQNTWTWAWTCTHLFTQLSIQQKTGPNDSKISIAILAKLSNTHQFICEWNHQKKPSIVEFISSPNGIFSSTDLWNARALIKWEKCISIFYERFWMFKFHQQTNEWKKKPNEHTATNLNSGNRN